MQEVYTYQGELTNTALSGIIHSMENTLKDIGEKRNNISKINSVLIECCQNVMHHEEKPNDGTEYVLPLVSVAKEDDSYYISTRNLVTKSGAEGLKKYIERINAMTKEELRQFHKEILVNGQINEKGGGGLGIVNIARKAKDSKLSFNFQPYADNHLLFSLIVSV